MIGIKVKTDNKYAYVTMNYRHIVENEWLDDLKYICAPTKHHAKRYTFRVLTSIGVTREINRHRTLSILEQSTRYCNFSKDKFDKQISFCKPCWINLNTGIYNVVADKDILNIVGDGYIKSIGDASEENMFLQSCLNAEANYMSLIAEGWPPQKAREILSLCTATEAVYTGFSDQWGHFLRLRYLGTTGAPHPNMKELATKIYDICIKNNIIAEDELE